MDFTHFQGTLAWARQQNIPLVYAMCLQAQAMLETGNFTSNIYCQYNNAFGMRPAMKRPQNRVGIADTANGQFAIYANVQASFEDRVALDLNFGNPVPQDAEDIGTWIRSVLDNGYIGNGDKSSYIRQFVAHLQQVAIEAGTNIDTTAIDYEDIENGGSMFGNNIWVILVGLVIGFVGFQFLKKKKYV